MRELDRLGEDLAVIARDLARHSLQDADVQRLLTITGVNMAVAVGAAAAIGDVARFPSPGRLVSYFGLNPSVRQSGLGPAQHGRITKQGRAHARAMLVEAAWAAAKAPGPLGGFFLRIRARRGEQIATVATARKLAVLCWHLLARKEDYAWCRPALHAKKRRDLELKAGFPSHNGGNKTGTAYAYNLKPVREQERRWVEQAERTAWPRPESGTFGPDALGNLARFVLLPGQRHDNVGTEPLIRGVDFEALIADKAFDSNVLRATLNERGALAVIPPKADRKTLIPHDAEMYKWRHLIENFFQRLKEFRRIASRYDKTDTSFAATIYLVGAFLTLK